MSGTSSPNHFEDLALARQLQEEEDAALALALQQDDRASKPSSSAAGALQPSGRLPGERLAGPAHSSVHHLGRGTASKLQTHFLKAQQPLTLAELLRIFRGTRREELLGLIDAGQRQRVEAELVALDLDFPAQA
jgi:hypothetical protein